MRYVQQHLGPMLGLEYVHTPVSERPLRQLSRPSAAVSGGLLLPCHGGPIAHWERCRAQGGLTAADRC